MNTNSKAKRILCFGDSNTWGIIPGTLNRHPSNIRWTGVLQKKLGSDFEVIEEGMTGRTTNLENPRVKNANGQTYLSPCLKSHNPLDVVIFLLGTNDLKDVFNRVPKDVAEAMGGVIKIAQKEAINYDGLPAKIIIVSPTLVHEIVKNIRPDFNGGPEKSKHLAEELEKVASKNDCKFIDLAKYVKASKIDGIHLDKEGHRKVAEVLFLILR